MKERPKEIMTIMLIGINILVFIALTMIGRTEDGYFMLQHGAMYEPYIIENQEYYRLFTSLFLHFGISHLLNNMVLLWALGSIFEKEAGKIRFLFCYFISGIGGNLLSLYWNTIHDRQIVSAGASGAICICKQGKARNAVRKRYADYGCTESLFWIYQYRRR